MQAALYYDRTLVKNLQAINNNKLLLKVKDSSANLAVAYAEGGKTAQMVGDAAIKIVKSVRHLRKGNFADAALALGAVNRPRANSRFRKAFRQDASKAVASGWLELQYGWKPLLEDIYGSCDELVRQQTYELLVTKKAVTKKRYPVRYVNNYLNGSAKGMVYQTGWAHYEVKTSVTFRRPDGPRRVMVQTGLTNPALIAWELVPFSFVVDWFLPVGQFLDTLDATLGLEFVSGYMTTFMKTSGNSQRSLVGVDAYGIVNDMFYEGSRSEVRCYRELLSSFPSTSLPRFKDPLSVSHMTSALALLKQTFRK
jgi:hypothetical protein